MVRFDMAYQRTHITAPAVTPNNSVRSFLSSSFKRAFQPPRNLSKLDISAAAAA